MTVSGRRGSPRNMNINCQAAVRRHRREAWKRERDSQELRAVRHPKGAGADQEAPVGRMPEAGLEAGTFRGAAGCR